MTYVKQQLNKKPHRQLCGMCGDRGCSFYRSYMMVMRKTTTPRMTNSDERIISRKQDRDYTGGSCLNNNNSLLLINDSYLTRSKNQLPRFAAGSWCDVPFASTPPPPRSGLAMREPPKLRPDAPSIEVTNPRVEPCLAASNLSFTAVNCASNL